MIFDAVNWKVQDYDLKNEEFPQTYITLKNGGRGEILEKKSRFIATLTPVSSEEEAAAFFETVKKRYWDAKHNCTAFVIGEKAQLTRCSDDGEPAGTAGKPMLEVLLAEEIRNAAVVVTRYFGGTLLGTGGLIRAYTQAVKAGIADAETLTMRYVTKMQIETDYNGIGKIGYLLEQKGMKAVHMEYAESVKMVLMVPCDIKKQLCKELTETVAGRITIEEQEDCYFADR